MEHNLDLILTLASGLTVALILGYIANKIKLSPLVGYLIAGVLVSPHSPGLVADMSISQQCAEIGVVLLMFGVGMHFKLSDLIAVKNVAVTGALIQIATSTVICALLVKILGWSWISGMIVMTSLIALLTAPIFSPSIDPLLSITNNKLSSCLRMPSPNVLSFMFKVPFII